MPGWLNILLLILFGFGLLVMLIAPLLLKSQHRAYRNFRIEPRAEDEVPPEARERIAADREDFEQAEFIWQGYYHFSHFTTGVETWFGLYRHATYSGLAGMTATIWQCLEGQPSRMALDYAELSGIFNGDFCLCVNNSPMMGAYEHDSKLSLRYPGESLSGLIRIYQRVKGEHERAGRYESVPPDGAVDRIIYQLRRELELQAADGIYHLDQASQEYRLTWTGAIVMAWRHLPPFAWLRSSRELRRARYWASRGT